MPIKKSTSAKKTTAAKSEAAEVTMEPITVQRTFIGGELNSDPSEILEHVSFPMDAKIGKVAVMVGTAADFGSIKASVTVSVPCFLEEQDEAAKYAVEKAKEYLDELAGEIPEVEADEEEEEEKPKGKKSSKKEVTSTRKAGKNAKAEEPEEEEEDASEETEDGEVALYDEDELNDMEEGDLKALCEEWEIAWPKSKKASVRKAEAISSILEKQAEYADEDDAADEADGEEADDDDDGIGAEDIEAMDRKQLEAFIDEYNEEADEGEELEVDLSDYPKNAKGLKTLKADLIEVLFAEEDEE